MLGGRWAATVSLSAALLQKAGLIRYSRGRITVLDPNGLRSADCRCYPTIALEFTKITEPPSSKQKASGTSRRWPGPCPVPAWEPQPFGRNPTPL